MKDVFRRLRRRFLDRHAPRSYSQCGEDLIVRFLLLDVLGRRDVRYLEVGAYDPWFLSNTALFYRLGFQGVLVEPDADLCVNLRRHRPRDLCVNVGIGDGAASEADFYVLSARTLSTFSRPEAERQALTGHRIDSVVRVPLVSINRLLREHFPSPPQFVSIDVEGLDEQILRSFDFDECRPDVLCVETASHSTNRREWKKSGDIPSLLREKRYLVYADTFINTIFVNEDIW
jgi:FkbM family methyltransferase